EVADGVAFCGVDKDEVERPFELGDEFKRVASLERHPRLDAGLAQVLLSELGAAFVDFERGQMPTRLGEAEGDPDARVSIRRADFEGSLGLDLADFAAQARALART